MRRFVRGALALACVWAVGGCGGDTTPPIAPDAGRDLGVSPCANDTECSNGVFCDGVERCLPSAVGADVRGCMPEAGPCSAGETCDESAGMCRTDCADADLDGHADGACGGDDCDDADADRYPGNTERCDRDGHDEDCNTATFAGSSDGDVDGDGFVSSLCCGRVGARLECGADCDDESTTVNPTALDACNAVDDDCDGAIDEDPTDVFFRDFDNDLYGDADTSVMRCSRPDGYALTPGDCSDSDPAVNPGEPERCNGGVDDNCDGIVDVLASGVVCACVEGSTSTCGGTDVGDCAYGTATCVSGAYGDCVGVIGPAAERCGGGDEDCDGTANEDDAMDASTWYADADGDLSGNTAVSRRACTAPSGFVANDNDCNDANAAQHPGATEVCDTVDNDCDGMTDEGVTTFGYRDGDGDGYGGGAMATTGCGRIARGGDCADNNANVHPGQASYFTTPFCASGRLDEMCSVLGCNWICWTTPTSFVSASYDYDCSAATELEPAATPCRAMDTSRACFAACFPPGGPCNTCLGSGFTTPGGCGESASYRPCNCASSTCVAGATVTRTRGCR